MPVKRDFYSLGVLRAVLPALLMLWLTFPAATPLHAQSPPPRQNGSARTAGPAPHEAQKLTLPGVENFGEVTPKLYRGSQPNSEGYRQLQKMGINIVVDFRNEKGDISQERQAVEALHMRFVSIPWSAWNDPTNQQVKAFFEVLSANPDKKVYVHCHHGVDRTGTMVAIYRLAVEKWSADEAVREMYVYHFHGFWFPHLEKFIRKFPKQLESDPVLRGTLPAPAPYSP